MNGVNRILSKLNVRGLVEALSSDKLKWADFHTLLLSIFEARIKKIEPSHVMRNYRKNRFSAIADSDPRELAELDVLLFDVLSSAFQRVELSPVNPLGANAVLTPIDPKVVLSTIRALEVSGDPSIMLTLESALRRSAGSNREIHLAASQRSLRLQGFSKDSGLSAHFRAFALVSAGKDTLGFNSFDLSSLMAHIEAWLDFLVESSKTGYKAQSLSVGISDIRIVGKLISGGRIERKEVIKRSRDQEFDLFGSCGIDLPDQVGSVRDISITHPELETNIRELQLMEETIIEQLRVRHPSVHFYFDLGRSSGMGYYSGLCYRVTAENEVGARHSLAGGGSCDWTRKLLSDGKEHLVTSGFGTEMFNKQFRTV